MISCLLHVFDGWDHRVEEQEEEEATSKVLRLIYELILSLSRGGWSGFYGPQGAIMLIQGLPRVSRG